ncbi:MAG: tetratricopeptide repeat protein [Gammaproteobacteria bacterium]
MAVVLPMEIVVLVNRARLNNCFSILLIVSFLMSVACGSPEEVAEHHLEKGKELFEKGEYDKASLELKTSAQSGDSRSETYYYMALLDEKTNNFKSMRENLLKTIELDSGNLEARQRLGKVLLLFGDLDRSLEQANYLLDVNPNDNEARLLKASVYLTQKKNDEAVQIIDSVLERDAENVNALSMKAAYLFQNNKVDEALVVAEKAIEKDSKNLPVRMFILKIHAKQKKSDAMIEDYRSLVNIFPDIDNFRFSLASAYAMDNKLDLAENVLREAVSAKPNSLEPKVVLLDFFNAIDKKRVADEYDGLLKASTNSPDIMIGLSQWMLKSGYLDEASTGLRYVLDKEGNSNNGLVARTILAEISINKKDYSKAAEQVADVLKVDDDFLAANLLRARLLLVENKVDQAIDLLNKLIWNNNRSDNAFALLGQAYLIKNDQKQADVNFKRALEIDPANIQAFVPVYGTYIKANQKETARQFLEKALNQKQNDRLLLTYKAELDISDKKWDDGQDAVRRLALIMKNSAVPLYFQANIFQGKGEYQDAIKLYKKILVDHPEHLNSVVNLIRSFAALKQQDKAMEFLEEHYAKHKDNLMIVGILSDLYVANHKYEKAKELLLNQMSRLPVTSAPLYLALAKVEAASQKGEAAVEKIYLDGLQAHPGDLTLLMALADLYQRSGNIAEAKKVYEQVLEKFPGTELAINNLAQILIDSDRASDNVRGLALAEGLKDKTNVYFQDTYAWGLVKNGRYDEALPIIESLIVREPKIPELRYHLGIAHLKAGNKATAIIELKQAVTLSEKYRHKFTNQEQAVRVLKELETR